MAETSNLSIYEPAPVVDISANGMERFAGLIAAGVNAWTQAGKLLVEMKEQDPCIFEKITAKYPGISWDILRAFESIGLNRTYPYLLLDTCPGSRKLMMLPYDDQVRIYQAKIDVVTGLKDGQPVVEKKRIQELTSFQVERLFFGNRIKSIPEQAADFEQPRTYKKPEKQRRTLESLSPAESKQKETEPVNPNLRQKQCFSHGVFKFKSEAGKITMVQSNGERPAVEIFEGVPFELKFYK